jgi:hypothetical protein
MEKVIQVTSSLIHITARTLLICAVIQIGTIPVGFADEAGIHPTAPPALKQPEIKDSFRYERRFLYKGKVLECDSNVQRDAERLRLIVADVPPALAELDTYQRNRQNVRTAAYVGSMGLIIALGGLLISKSFTDSNGNPTDTSNKVRGYSLAGGLGLTGISFIYGFSILSTNESHVDHAVQLHNQAHPDTPIELQFTTGFSL